VPCADTVTEYPPASKLSVLFDAFISAISVIPLGNSAWYKHDLPSADKSKVLSSRVPLLIAFPIFKVFSFGAYLLLRLLVDFHLHYMVLS
jgi:hypothetical protein